MPKSFPLKTFIFFLLLQIAIISFVAHAFAWLGVVVKVTDGDTLYIKDAASENIIKVRLYGIDAPEGKQHYGSEAAQLLIALAHNQPVSVTDMDIDRYGRNVAIVVLTANGQSLQELMLINGAAWVYTRYCQNCNGWKVLQKQAKQAGVGLWAFDATPPWVWRNEK